MVGKGAAQAHADSLIRQLAGKVQIPVLSTSMGRGVVADDHPLSVIAARSLALAKADVVLVMGARYPTSCHLLTECVIQLTMCRSAVYIVAKVLVRHYCLPLSTCLC